MCILTFKAISIQMALYMLQGFANPNQTLGNIIKSKYPN